jgi:8-oxo-dGTP pyrophosphatase MutT (NUDIX family)
MPAEPRDAATVVLMRDSETGIEVFLLTRADTMAFAPSAYVFPGGSVAESDSDESLPWTGRSLADFAAVMGVDDSLTRALVSAAVRETAEEAGVLLARNVPDDTVAVNETALSVAESLDRGDSLAQVLTDRALALDADSLIVWDWWLTPEASPRRYDTRFFLARMPEGQEARHRTSESVWADWMTARVAVERHDAEAMRMLRPTIATLRTLASVSTVDEALALAPAHISRTNG